MATDCLFCRIVRKEIPATLAAENGQCLAFRDINPQAPTHLLVIPREHVATLNDVQDPTVIAQMYQLAMQLAKSEGLADGGYRTVINTNADAGQTVFHIHLHLLGGRRMKWPPG
ncbi:MAG: histidine triad nucleotide-binding protein [Gemmatimonadaceae bacterium]